MTATPAQASENAITTEALTRRLSQPGGVTILDVRTPGEFHGGHIPGAVNVPVDQLGGYTEKIAQVDPELILVCQSGGRADTAQRRLAGAGARRGQVLTGGMGAWNSAGGATEAGRGQWGLERQVRLTAGSIVLVSILSSLAWPSARYVAGGIGGGLVFSALTNTCGMGALLAKLPYNKGRKADIDRAVASVVGA